MEMSCEFDLSDDEIVGATMRKLKDIGCFGISAAFFGGGGGGTIGIRFRFTVERRGVVEALFRTWGYTTFTTECDGAILVAE